LDSWCGGETGEGDGLARRDDQEAGELVTTLAKVRPLLTF